MTDPADAEAAALLRWMADDHFTFLGYRDAETGASLGISRVAPTPSLPPGGVHAGLTVRKADARATVHRPVYMDQVCIGPHELLGLWARTAYNTTPLDIPLLRRKVDAVIERSGLPRDSHSGKDLGSILDTFPRDELFQIGEDELYATAMGILSLQERQRVRLFVRRDELGRFFSCLVYVPRDRFTTELVRRIEAILLDALGGTGVESTSRVSESVLARLHVIVTVPKEGDAASPDVPAIEAQLADAVGRGPTTSRPSSRSTTARSAASTCLRRYGDAFPAAYRENVDPRSAVGDVQRMESLIAGSTGTDLLSVVTRPVDAPRGFVRMRLFRIGEPMALSDVVPLLEHLGVRVVDERPYEVHPADAPPLWIYDIGLSSNDLGGLDGDAARADFCEAFGRLWRGEAESDGFNRLVLRAGLTSRKVAVLRAYAKYLRQIGSTFSQSYIEDTLAGNAAHRRDVAAAVRGRFDPDRTDDAPKRRKSSSRASRRRCSTSRASTRTASSRASSTSSWPRCARTGTSGRHWRPEPYMSFKLDPARVPDLPLPRPALRGVGVLAAVRGRAPARRARSRVAASGGRTGERTSAPRSSA